MISSLWGGQACYKSQNLSDSFLGLLLKHWEKMFSLAEIGKRAEYKPEESGGLSRKEACLRKGLTQKGQSSEVRPILEENSGAARADWTLQSHEPVTSLSCLNQLECL